MIPHASAIGPASAHTLGELSLPHLSQLLGSLESSGQRLGSDEDSLNTPYELALASLRGTATAPVPTAAWLAQSHGLDASLSWALLTPLHLSVGGDQISAMPPETLALDDLASQAFFAALGLLWPQAEGWACHWVSPYQWLIAHPDLAGVELASLDRVVSRNVVPWMPEDRLLRRLQNEVQMLLHQHPLQEAREAAGELLLNSVWISGCGSMLGQGSLPAGLTIDSSLRAPLLAGDWPAWAMAWAQLDADLVAQALTKAQAGDAVQLTLCGERFAQTFSMSQRSVWQRLWQKLSTPNADAGKILGAL